MFTGIIEEVGSIRSFTHDGSGATISISARIVTEGRTLGASICVSGVCLTIASIESWGFTANLAPETIRRSNLGSLGAGASVNLERALLATGRLDGHIVQGHVDGVGELQLLDHLGNGNWWLMVRIPAALDRYVVEKGSICIDGISLTVAQLQDAVLSCTIVPSTYERTNLKHRRRGDMLNLEVDVIAKYVEKLLPQSDLKAGLTVEKMRRMEY